MSDVLVLEDFGIAFGEHVVLDGVSFRVPQVGLRTIMGPVAAGKSTLLRTVAGLTTTQPAVSSWGRLERRVAQERCALIRQRVEFLTTSVRDSLCAGLPNRDQLPPVEQTALIEAELHARGLESFCAHFSRDVLELTRGQRHVIALVRELLANPALLLVDELTARLEEEESLVVIRLLKAEAQRRAVVCVTHNQRHARALGGPIALLAGGKFRATQPACEFFDRPENDLVRSFVSTGGLDLPSPNATVGELNPEYAQIFRPRRAPPNRALTPTGFLWLLPGRLAGCARPGLLGDLNEELGALGKLGIRFLIGLEETETVSRDALRRFGIEGCHFPVEDMGVPEPPVAHEICEFVCKTIDRGIPLAIHCRAGLGRTGTLLACALIYNGAAPDEAFRRIRKVNPRWIQSDRQLEFLGEFAQRTRCSV